MARYVYGCDEHPANRIEIAHGMTEDPLVRCPECLKPMHRIPQAFRFYHNPGQVLLDKLNDRFRDLQSAKKYGTKRKYARGTF